MKKEEPPINKPFVDLGEQSVCNDCEKRYCSCEKRLNGTFENCLPIVTILPNGEKRYKIPIQKT